MAKKKDSEEEQKEKLIAEIIKVKFGIGMSQPTENMTTLEREDNERLSRAAYPSKQKNASVEIAESLAARLREKSLKELHTILEEESKKRVDGHSSEIINNLVSKIQAKVNGEYNDKRHATIKSEKDCQHQQDGTDDQTEPTSYVKKPTAVSIADDMQHDKEMLAGKWREEGKTFIQMELSKELAKHDKYNHINPATIEKLTRKA